MTESFDFTYLSFGAGVQSSALLVMSALGLRGCPRANIAIFADTQGEPKWVYEHLAVMEAWAADHGLTLIRCTAGDMAADLSNKKRSLAEKRFVSLPAYTLSKQGAKGILRRQCTREYKIDVIERKVREYLGYRPRQKMRYRCRALIGISLDEVQRAKPSRTSWITNCYPLLDSAITREGCLNLLREFGLPTPQKSACVFCPYHDDSYWYDLKTKHPDEWQRAVAIDSAIRNLTRASVEQPCYLHASCMPLPLVELKPRHVGETQLGFWDSFSAECDGMCGV